MAVQFGPEALQYSTGGPIADEPIYVRLRGSQALATLYADAAESAGADNPVMTDSAGNLVFFTQPGYYDLVFSGVEYPIVVGSPGGAVEQTHTHVQNSPESEWVYDPQLPTRPVAVYVVESTGDPLEAAWKYIGGLIHVYFDAPTTGAAYAR